MGAGGGGGAWRPSAHVGYDTGPVTHTQFSRSHQPPHRRRILSFLLLLAAVVDAARIILILVAVEAAMLIDVVGAG